jgi:long-chain acyl-CoA synthetase
MQPPGESKPYYGATVARETLLDFFEDFSARDDVFIVHDDGYRVRRITYRHLAAQARLFARRLGDHGLAPGDCVVVWSENRTEWVIAFWGCLLAGGVLVPVDYRASSDLLLRIVRIVSARVVLIGEELTTLPWEGTVWKLTEAIPFDSVSNGDHSVPVLAPHQRPGPGTLAEVIFTSGATAEPKGVTITHRNILANVIPIEREITKYRWLERPFHPVRFLNLLPLSHMFGQSMATFVPPLIGGTVVFSHGYSPVEVLRQIKTRRVSVLVCVPKVLDVLREHIQRVAPDTLGADPLAGRHWSRRWWHYRHVHRLFGWKFWCIVCGAAPLDPALEAYWRKLGFLVVQGYGLTETAPIVTLNHPFRASSGTVGTPIGGVQVRIADDGEILVRGENVTAGYYKGTGGGGEGSTVEIDASAFRDGWFHTGDVGEIDAAGRLLIKGRKKEMIVTPQGLNVFPEDVERALLGQPGVKDAAVVGRTIDGEERIHAVLVLDGAIDVGAVVKQANAGLEDHQRIWSTSIWPGATLPRTEGTQKLKRRELARWVAGEPVAPRAAHAERTVAEIVGRYAAGVTITPDTTLDTLGLSSLDRVELMMALEEAFQTTLDESALAGATTIRDLERTIQAEIGASTPAISGSAADSGMATQLVRPSGAEIAFPSWNRSRVVHLVRRISLPTWILPLGRLFMQLKVDGLHHLSAVTGPVVFAANHVSHLDTPAILIALPPRWRYLVAPAMAKEFFHAHFNPASVSRREWFLNSLNYYLAAGFFNAFPLPQREAGTRQTLRYIGEVTADGYSVLIFPEGRRNETGQMTRFMPGIGMIGARLGLPIVPVRIDGLEKVLSPKMRFPKRGPVRVSFGNPLELKGDDYAGLTRQVEEAVRRLAATP